MKKVLTSLLVAVLLMTACFVSAVPASAATAASPEEDFEVYDGVLIDYLGEGGDIVIPDSLGITEIDDSAFASSEAAQMITSVVVPDGVTRLGYACFTECANLEKVVLPKTLESIGRSCFAHCTSLTSIALPGSLKVLSRDCFAGCKALTTVKMEEGIEVVETYAFCAVPCKQFVFPSSVYEIAGAAADNLVLESANFIVMNPDCKFLHKDSDKRDIDDAPFMLTFAGTAQYKTRCTVKSLKDAETIKTAVAKVAEKYNYINFVGITEEAMQEAYDKQAPTDADFSPEKSATTTDTDKDVDTDDDDDTSTNKKPSSSKKDNNSTTSGDSNSNLKTILIIFGAVALFFLLAIIVLVVLFVTGVIGGKKPAKKVKEVATEADAAPVEEVAEEVPTEEIPAEETPVEDENN